MTDVAGQPVLSRVKPGQIRTSLPPEPPVHGEPLDRVFRDFKVDCTDYTNAVKCVFYLTDKYVTFENITIIGDGTNGYGINGSARTDITIRNCNISNVSVGVYLANRSDRLIMDGCRIDNCASYATYIGGFYSCIVNNHCYSNGKGMYIPNAFYSVISQNTCYDNGEYGIYLASSIAGQYNIVSNNICVQQTDPGDATSVYGIYIASDDNVVNDNNCSLNVNTGAGTGYRLYIHANADNTTVDSNHLVDNDTNYSDNGSNTTAGDNNTA